jgi:beta-glucanase (GH16 family)
MLKHLRGAYRLSVPATFTLLLAACGGGGGADSPVVPPFFPEPSAEWQLVWSDEFDGDALDTGNWEAQIGDGSDYGLERWGNNEQQWYLAENATVADGFLTIAAKAEEVVPGFPYTSARLRSANRFDFKYGRVEIRAKAAPGQGLWSAGWMLPTDSPYGTWAAIGEIDIMEIVNADTDAERTFQTLHYGFPWPLNQQTGTDVDVADPAGEFYTYAIEWEGDEIRWFVDDLHVLTIGSDHYYSYYYKNTTEGYVQAPNDAPFDTPFPLLLNLAVGGNLPGPVEPTDIPSEMVVDYVRVYSCSYNEPDGDGCNSNADRNLDRPDAQDPFQASFPLYTDAAESLSWTIGGERVERPLGVNSFWNNDGALSFSEVPEDGRGTVIEVVTSNMGNVSVNAVDGEPTELFGFGNNPNFFEEHAGSLSFDMYIDSAGTDIDSSILIKMDSGFPALGFKELKVAEMPLDQWFTYHVKVNDLLANSGEQPLDTRQIISFFVLEPTSSASVKVDNIALSCGHPGRNGCGIRTPGGDVDGEVVPVFVDGEVGALWDKGICGSDSGGGFVDYCGDGNTNNLINWTITDSGDPDIGSAVSVNFGTNGADGVFFFGSAGGVDLSSLASAGKLKFDLNVPPATAAAGMVYKVDCFFPCSTGDQPLDLSGYTPGTWASFEFPLSELSAKGLDLTRVNAGLVLFPTFGDQQGYSFEVANVRYEVEGEGGDGGGFRLAGTWVVASEPGSLGVGPAEFDVSWWNGDDGVIAVRGCYYDDEYIFGLDGSYSINQQDETWVEAWQGAAESCAAPVAPHDGSVAATYDYDEEAGTLTLNGQGAYLGLSKAVNGAELTFPGEAPASVTYNVYPQEDGSLLASIEAGDGVWWNYKLVKTAEPPALPPVVGVWKARATPGSIGVGPAEFDVSWWNADAGVIAVRDCFFDDTYTIAADGTFSNQFQDATWVEAWQGGAESCAAPVAPHDGSTPATWEYDADAGTLTLDGQGAYIGISKAVNGAELTFPGEAPSSVTYNVYPNEDGSLGVTIEAGAGVWWNYVLVPQ